MGQSSFKRPYLVIPKLIEQPTWGGDYITSQKKWLGRAGLAGRKIGQSYELFSGSNLSLAVSSEDEQFIGELTDRDAVQIPTKLENAVPLKSLIEQSAEGVFGNARVARAGKEFDLLIKFTQSLGNSFQIHIKDGLKHPQWRPKPESWYYLEPGMITYGVKPKVDWRAYEQAVTALAEEMSQFEHRVKAGELSYEDVQADIKGLIKRHNPWQFVNLLQVKKGALVDLSGGGIHHSWEEDTKKLPLGNVLYELQLEAMDDISTIRNFDKGKMSSTGGVRPLNIKDYFELIDRSADANDPSKHIGKPETLINNGSYVLKRLLTSKYYVLNKLSLPTAGAEFSEGITQFRHLFVENGQVEVSTDELAVLLTSGHSAFVPAGAQVYTIKALTSGTKVLISY